MAVIKVEESKTKMIDMGRSENTMPCKVYGKEIRYPSIYLDDTPKELYSKLKVGESFSCMIEGKVTSISSIENEKKEIYNCELEIHSMSIPE